MAEQVTGLSFNWTLSLSQVSSTLPNSSSHIKFIQFSFKRVKALLVPGGLKDLAFLHDFMKVCREIARDCWFQHWNYAADTCLSQKMKIVVSLVFFMSERNKHRDELFQPRRTEAVSRRGSGNAAFLLCWGEGVYCALTVKWRSIACALQGQTASEDSNGKNCLFIFFFSQKIFVFMVGFGS